jgi:tripartite-type tricarboxylate transporter receptor subunit TctC
MTTGVPLKALGTAMICITLGTHAFASAQQVGPAATYPNRPVRMVVGFTPGGQPDITARMIAPKMYEALGQQVIVDNRPGAGSIIGAKIVAESAPDGYTLLFASSSHVASPAVRARLPYDTIKDFAGITLTSNACYVLVVPASLPVKTAGDLIALARAKPGQLNFASPGTGSGSHFGAELFKRTAGIDVVHVPYKGIPEALNDVISGRVQFFMSPLASALNLVRDGRVRALAVTATKRFAVYADVPTLAESGLPGFQWDSWSGLLAPAKTPRAIIDKLNREVTRALELPDIRQRLIAMGVEPAHTTAAEFDRLIADQVAIIIKLARQAGIKPE